jgi:uncharacterized protein (TIGR00255 family)
MPVYSMTGFASTQMPPPAAVCAEVRSINNRFLDLTFKLPDELRAFEARWRQLVSQQIRRGKVEVRMFRPASEAGGRAAPNPSELARLAEAQSSIMAAVPLARPLGVADVLRLAAEPTPSAWPEASQLDSLLQTLLTGLVEARAAEGARLSAVLRECVGQLRRLAEQAQPLVDDSVGQQRERFVARWREAMSLVDGSAAVPSQAAAERALAEVAAFSLRVDVAEELTRLRSHLEEIDSLLVRGGELGKRLDFLIQELHREVNTLGSKSASLPLTRLSVDMKVQVEQMREQVQNIE